MRGVKRSVTEKYSEHAHFIYELLQNADDTRATNVRFFLDKNGLFFAHDGEIHFSISDHHTEDADKKLVNLAISILLHQSRILQNLNHKSACLVLALKRCSNIQKPLMYTILLLFSK